MFICLFVEAGSSRIPCCPQAYYRLLLTLNFWSFPPVPQASATTPSLYISLRKLGTGAAVGQPGQHSHLQPAGRWHPCICCPLLGPCHLGQACGWAAELSSEASYVVKTEEKAGFQRNTKHGTPVTSPKSSLGALVLKSQSPHTHLFAGHLPGAAWCEQAMYTQVLMGTWAGEATRMLLGELGSWEVFVQGTGWRQASEVAVSSRQLKEASAIKYLKVTASVN